MTDRPIIFSAAMVQALLAARKTQHRGPITRLRIRKRFTKVTEFGPSTTKGYDWHFRDSRACWNDLRDAELRAALPYAIGDRLWVRESWSFDAAGVWTVSQARQNRCFGRPVYAADQGPHCPWWSSATMPREMSRLTLIVTDVSVQRVQEISADDAAAEGLWRGKARKHLFWHQPWQPRMFEGRRHTEVFAELWDTIHAKRPEHQWKANPWVCALTFDVVKANIDEVETGVTVRQIEGRAV